MKIHKEDMQVSWISGMPRSGTTWLSQIFASSPDVRLKFCPLFSYEFKNSLNENSSGSDWADLFWGVYNTESEFLDQDYLRDKGFIPSFVEKNIEPKNLVIKSTRFHNLTPHILKHHRHVRFVHLVRNPCATIYSWMTNKNEFPADADPMKEWRSGSCRKKSESYGEFWGFDDWVAVTLQALELEKLYPKRFKVLRYEDLVNDTESSVKAIFSYLGISYDKQTIDFITLSHSRHDSNKRSVFKKPELNKDWANKLPPAIISTCFSELKSTQLEVFLND